MIRHVWSVLCTRSVIDSTTNNVSLIEVVEQLTLTPSAEAHVPPNNAPVVVPGSFELVTLWTRGVPDLPEQAKTRIKILAPGGKELATVESLVNLSTHQRVRNRGQMAGLPIYGEGRYEFSVQLFEGGDWKEVASVPLEVSFGPVLN